MEPYDGNHRVRSPVKSCAVCLKENCNTALGFRGEAEMAVAGLSVLGLSERAATQMVEMIAHDMGCDPGMVPKGFHDWPVRVCKDCAARAGFEVRTLPELVMYTQPSEVGRLD